MRTLLLTLLLTNLLLIAWYFWVDPTPSPPSDVGADGLALFPSTPIPSPRRNEPGAVPANQPAASQASDEGCLLVGPLPDVSQAEQVASRLSDLELNSRVIGRDTQLWLGHWVQIRGFSSLADAESARQRLATGGIPDAYLMQEGAQSVVSLGVFRERGRADRIAAAVHRLGFAVTVRDRYRPAVEQWVLVRLDVGQTLEPALLRLPDDRSILRVERTSCESNSIPAAAPAN